jgi:transcriptional regulator with XRE-family HTH domain
MSVNGGAIRAIRVGKGVSQTALATRVGLSPSALCRIESGQRGRRYLADPSVLHRIAVELGVTVAALTKDEAA